MYNSSINTQTEAAIAGAKITPTTPRYCAVINKKKYIINGCKSKNLLKIYGLNKLFSAH